MKLNRLKTIIPLVLLILLGGFLRLYKLDKFPPSLFGDEVDVGYQAYSILKTGKDYMSQPWPISFHSIADWRTPLFLYSTVPFVAIFGLSEWGVRLAPAIFGILTLPVFFLLIRKIFKNEPIALAGTFFLSISMWHLQYSRAAFEVTQMLFLFITGTYFFLKGLERWKYLLLSAVMLGLTPYSYNTAKFFLPIFVLLLSFSFKEQLLKISFKKLLLVGMVFLISLLPMGYDILLGKAGDRFSILSVFTDPTTVPQIGFDRQVDAGFNNREVVLGMRPSLSSRIFHNKFLFWGTVLTKNYFKAFSTDFLFIFGDIKFRHSIQGGFGELYWIDAIFLLMGLWYLLKLEDKKNIKLILGWLLLAPVPSALTRDGGDHATRLILMLPPLLILISFGFFNFIKKFKKRNNRIFTLSLFLILYSIFFILYLHRYFVHYPSESEEWWHCGFKEAGRYVLDNEDKYKYVVFSDSGEPPLIFTLFWLKIDPKIMQGAKLSREKVNEAIEADRLPGTKYFLGHVSKEKMKVNGLVGTLSSDILYVMPEGETGLDYRYHAVPPTIKLLDTIYYPSGRVAKYIMTGL